MFSCLSLSWAHVEDFFAQDAERKLTASETARLGPTALVSRPLERVTPFCQIYGQLPFKMNCSLMRYTYSGVGTMAFEVSSESTPRQPSRIRRQPQRQAEGGCRHRR